MRRAAILVAVALLADGTAAFEATSKNWEEKVMKPVNSGKMAFVKFLAPW